MVPLPETPPVKYVYVERGPRQSDISDTLLLPIPGRSAARGEVTHKTFKDMNRAERRAVLSNKP